MKIYYDIGGDHVDPNDKNTLIKSSKKFTDLIMKRKLSNMPEV